MHTVRIDASQLAGGVYVLRLEGDGFVGTQKLVVVEVTQWTGQRLNMC